MKLDNKSQSLHPPRRIVLRVALPFVGKCVVAGASVRARSRILHLPFDVEWWVERRDQTMIIDAASVGRRRQEQDRCILMIAFAFAYVHTCRACGVQMRLFSCSSGR